MTFQLDTSGVVGPMDAPRPTDGHHCVMFEWSDLTPFAQGFTEALLRELDAQRWAAYRASCALPGRHLPVPLHPKFDWLAGEALALILRDSAAALRPGLARTQDADSGRNFWALRQRGIYGDIRSRQYFPPLTVSLGDDGKVRLAVAS